MRTHGQTVSPPRRAATIRACRRAKAGAFTFAKPELRSVLLTAYGGCGDYPASYYLFRGRQAYCLYIRRPKQNPPLCAAGSAPSTEKPRGFPVAASITNIAWQVGAAPLHPPPAGKDKEVDLQHEQIQNVLVSAQ